MSEPNTPRDREGKQGKKQICQERTGQGKTRVGKARAFPDFPGEGWMGGFNCTRRENAKQMRCPGGQY